MARIELVDLTKTFGSVVAVKNLSFVIEDGEFVVFVGPSGCGKTTTLRMIAGFEDPTAGEIRIDGRVVNDIEPRDRGLGMVFQTHALFPHKNVAQNIEFGLRMKKVPPEERVKRVREVAEMVRIAHLLDKMPGQCSGGESQRVALARTLVTNPSTFLLDEPLSSLDAKLRRELRAECDRLHQTLRRTFIFVTHDQEEAMTLADRIVVMRNGEIEQFGSPMEIYSNPVSYFVADFFGSPSMNLIAGEVVHEAGSARFRSPRFDLPLPARLSTPKPGARLLAPRRSASGRSTWACGSGAAAATGLATRRNCRSGWSSRSARTRCSTSTTARRVRSLRSARAWRWPRSSRVRASRSRSIRTGCICSGRMGGASEQRRKGSA